MSLENFKKTLAALAAFAFVVMAGMLFTSRLGHAQDGNGTGNNGQDEQFMIQQGYAIAPVPLNTNGKDHDLVGLGSFLVNAVADCNGCHNSDPNDSEYAPANNPYLLMTPKGPFTGVIKVNPATYMAGGQVFGPFVSRNLTPDYRGLAEGGRSLSEFLTIMQTGVDMDRIQETLPAPLNGALLQVMPWPTFRNMSVRDLTAIYEYLSAIPCINNTGAGLTLPAGYNVSELANTCTPK